jgi:rhamnosyltransferase
MSIPTPANIAVVVPTLSAANDWRRFAASLLACVQPEQVLVLDSSSDDGTADLARAIGFRVHSISRTEFNHGGTRQLATQLLPTVEFLIFLTQDAVLAEPDAIRNLLEPFSDPNVAAAFGRQLPRPEAGPIEAHARFFNYPAQSSVRTLASREVLGFKAIFLSNSFAAYRREALLSVGGFPANVIFGEDTIIAAKLLLAGRKIAYASDATAYHSHCYTWRQEFKRYFDIGVLHSREGWLLDEFGGASREGHRFIASELAHLWHAHRWLVPSALIRSALKFGGYRLGKIESKISLKWKRRLSMHPGFWK